MPIPPDPGLPPCHHRILNNCRFVWGPGHYSLKVLQHHLSGQYQVLAIKVDGMFPSRLGVLTGPFPLLEHAWSELDQLMQTWVDMILHYGRRLTPELEALVFGPFGSAPLEAINGAEWERREKYVKVKSKL